MKFDKDIADYVDGLLKETDRGQIDKHRQLDPEVDLQVRLYGEVVSALTDAPTVKAPAGIDKTILAAIRRREETIRTEKKEHQKAILSGMLLTVIGSAILLFLARPLIALWDRTGQLFAVSASLVEKASGPVLDLHQLGAALSFLSQDIQLPLVSTPLPMSLLVSTACAVLVLFLAKERSRTMY